MKKSKNIKEFYEEEKAVHAGVASFGIIPKIEMIE